MRDTTEIIINEDGSETHESWVKLVASKVSGQRRLFDSEINHSHYISVRVYRCQRQRDLKHDSLFTTKMLMEVSMSHAQWGAFVSSFGEGSGVPATLDWFDGQVPQAPFESRLDASHKEVRGAADEALAKIQEDFAALEKAFEANEGKRALRERIRTLHYAIKNGPANIEYTAKTLTEHTENVVTKARADIEGMVRDAQTRLGTGEATVPLLGTGEEER